MVGMILSFAAAIAGIIAIFVLSQKNAIFGPDGIGLASALLAAAYHVSLNIEYILWGSTALRLTLLSEIVCAFVVLLCVRELFGWMKVRFSLSWCLAQRIAQRCTAPQISLLVFVAWIMLPLAGLAWFRGSNVYEVFWICVVGFIATSTFGFLCLWKYGKDLSHFKKQLSNYQNGKPITVGDGAFAQTEAQLLDVQAQHEEAVRTAVTSERFKVELISNVSHDLRTPLAAALSLAMEFKDKEQILPLLQGILRTAQEPWDMSATCLYHRIAGTEKKAVDKAMTSALLHSVAQYAEYDFLRDDPRFQNILEECNQILTRDFQSIEA